MDRKAIEQIIYETLEKCGINVPLEVKFDYMTLQIQQHLAKAIIHHLNGNTEQYEKYARQATELYKRDKHLYVSIGEIIEAKGA